jgi:hypothetical protein
LGDESCAFVGYAHLGFGAAFPVIEIRRGVEKLPYIMKAMTSMSTTYQPSAGGYNAVAEFYYGGGDEMKKIVVEADAKPIKPLRLPRKILKIGRLGEALQNKVKEQLLAVQGELACDYVHFDGVFGDGIRDVAGCPVSVCGTYEGLLGFFMGIDLLPLVRLDVSRAPRRTDGSFNIDESLRLLKMFMGAVISGCPREYWEGSCFEVAHSGPIEDTGFMEWYASAFKLLKSYSGKVRVGLSSLDGGRRVNYDALEERLVLCGRGRCDPDFVTVDADAGKVRHIINDSGTMTTEMYVAEMVSPGSAAPFGIAALARGFVEHGDEIAGAMFWLESGPRSPVSGEEDGSVTGLLSPGMAKRPPYHFLREVYRLGGVVLHQSDGLCVVRKEDGEYGVIAYNARPFAEGGGAPGFIDLEIALAGMPPGRYRSEAFAFNGQRRVDMGDGHAETGRESCGAPSVEASEGHTNGEYAIHQRLGPDCAAVIRIERVSG